MQTSASLSTLTAAALIHEQHTHSHALSHDCANAQTGLWPRLAHAHSVTHSGIIGVVKPEKKSERDMETESGTETGETEGGKGTVIAQTEAFYPRAVFKCCHVRDPGRGTPLFPPVDVVATNFFFTCIFPPTRVTFENCYLCCRCSVSVFLSLSVWLKVVPLGSLVIVCFEGCDRRVLECVVLLFSHFSLSVSSSLTLAVCLCVCVPSLVRCFGTKRNTGPPHSLFCFL